MKNLITCAVFASTLVFAVSTLADQKSDNALLTECKTSISESIEGVTNVKVSTIRSRRGIFTAKFRVTANGDRSVMTCTSEDGAPIALSCVSGSACEAAQVVAN